MSDQLPYDEVMARVRRDVQNYRSMTEYAIEIGTSLSYVSNVLNGRSPPSARMLRRVGVVKKTTRVVTYSTHLRGDLKK
jgi:transcriptional regulator with XRE-family HTH domain